MSPSGLSQAVVRALAEYKLTRVGDSNPFRLDLSRLAGIEPGEAQTELNLLDFAVAPTLRVSDPRQGVQIENILSQLDDPALAPAKKHELEQELRHHRATQWSHLEYGNVRAGVPVSFARAFLACPRLTVIGDPGAGKTVLTRLVFLACLHGTPGEQARRLLHDDDRFDLELSNAIESLSTLLPVRLRLGRVIEKAASRDVYSIEEFVRDQLTGAPAVLLDELGAVLREGRIFLLCDGLDEVPERHRRSMVDALEAFFERYRDVRLMVTSRPNGYHPRVPGLVEARLAPLHPRQQRRLVTRLHRLIERRAPVDAENAARARRRTNALLRELQSGGAWSGLGSNPLLLTLSALSPTRGDGVPRHEVFVFENFIRTLLWEWRSELNLSKPEANQLMDVWSTVALELVQQEKRAMGVRNLFLRILDEIAQRAPASRAIDAERALRLALEAGLIQEEGEALVFWHSLFAEFLAARALVRRGGPGTAARLLAEQHLPRLVLRFAAAFLDHVCSDPKEVAALVRGLLERDEHGSGRLLRPGLRLVSDCMGYGVRLAPELTEQVWSIWAQVLADTPPSPLWADFGRLSGRKSVAKPSLELLERFAQVEAHGIREVQEGIARWIAPAAAKLSAARKLCERWLKQNSTSELKIQGALGLASLGSWTHDVIEVLGGFAGNHPLELAFVGDEVRKGGAALRQELKDILRISGQDGLRVSAACLLLADAEWDAEVIAVLEQVLAGKLGNSRLQDTVNVLRLRTDLPAVRDSLLDWMNGRSSLGESARQIIRDVAPLIDGMPEQVLLRAAQAQPENRREADRLLTELGEEWRGFFDALRQSLKHESFEQRMYAARLLLSRSPDDACLHEAMRQGLGSEDDFGRAQWAWLALGVPVLFTPAMAALQRCARFGAPKTRSFVYEHMREIVLRMDESMISEWIECANDKEVPEDFRLAAAQILSKVHAEDRHRVKSIFEGLLGAEDPTIRWQAAHELRSQHKVQDPRVVGIEAEAAVHLSYRGEERIRYWSLLKHNPFVSLTVQAILRGLPEEERPSDAGAWGGNPNWSFIIEQLVEKDPPSIEFILDAVARPGVAGKESTVALLVLMNAHAFAREAIRARIEHNTKKELSLRTIFTLVIHGFDKKDIAPACIEACRVMTTQGLSQGQLRWLAERLHFVNEGRDVDLWREALHGADREQTLAAAEALAVRLPDQGRQWVQEVLPLLLADDSPVVRVDAARVALFCQLFEDKAQAVLVEALSLKQPYRRRTHWIFNSFESQVIGRGRKGAGVDPFDALRWGLNDSRVDAEAMHALCVYLPHVGIPQLELWLHDPEVRRSDDAVKILVKREESREAVRAAVAVRLFAPESDEREHLLAVLGHHGLKMPGMMEQLVSCLNVKPVGRDRDVLSLLDWVKRDARVWSVLRKQPPERLPSFAYLLQYVVPVTRDAVCFAVELALLRTDGTAVELAVSALARWCAPSAEEGADNTRSDTRTPSSKTVRGWLRMALKRQPPPGDLHAIIQFDNLARIGRRTAGRRIEVLRRALGINLVAVTLDTEQGTHLFDLQVEAADRLHALGGRDERLLPIFESAVYVFSTFPFDTFRRVDVLLSVRTPDDWLRRLLCRQLSRGRFYFPLGDALDVLKRAGVPAQQCIDALRELLHESCHIESSIQVPDVLDAMARLGLEREQIADLVSQIVSAHGESLSADIFLRLSRRPELRESLVAKLLLRAIAQKAHGAIEQWLNHFALLERGPDDNTYRWARTGDEFLPLRLRGLKRMSLVKDSELVDTVLAEMADETAANGTLGLYRRVQTGERLSETEWHTLANRLARCSDDDRVSLFAKEWLTLNLWTTLEPETVNMVNDS